MGDRARKYGVRPRDGKWVARPYVNGQHVWIGTFETEDEALRAAIERYDELRRLPTNKETVQSFADRWIKDYPRPKQSTNELNHAAAKRFAAEVDPKGKVLIREFGRLDARRYAKSNPSGARIMRAMFSDARDEGLIEEHPFLGLRLPSEGRAHGRKKIAVLGGEELGLLLETARASHPNFPFAEMVEFAAESLMRPSEIFGLEWPDIAFDREEIWVRRQIYKGRCQLPKSNTDRKIVLTPRAADALRRLNRFTPIVMRDERGVERPVNLIFRNKSGGAMSATSLHHYWRVTRSAFEAALPAERREEFRAVRNPASPEMDFYELRHYGATNLLEMFRANGEDGAYDVAIQLGHEDEGELVRSTYGHPDGDLSRERLKRLFKTNVQPLRAVDDEEAANG